MRAVRCVTAGCRRVTLVAPQSMTLPEEYLRARGLTPEPPPVRTVWWWTCSLTTASTC